MGISRLFGLCFAILFASSVNAAVTIDLGPSDYRNWGTGSYQHRPGGIGSSFGQGVRLPPTLGTLNVTRNPVIPYGSVVNGMKNFVRITPGGAAASAAVTAAFLAMDWFFDQDSGEWMRSGVDVAPPDTSNIYWTFTADSQFGIYSTPVDACAIGGDRAYPGAELVSVSNAWNDPIRWRCQLNFRGSDMTWEVRRYGSECPVGYGYDQNIGACVQTMPVPLTQADWAALEGELVTMPPAIVGGSAESVMQREGQVPGYHDTTITGPSSVTGPETTSTTTDPVTGDTIVTNNSTTTNISYGDETITTTSTTTSTTYQNGQQTSTTVTTETPGELPVLPGAGESVDWPGFCDWAIVVCDWLNWTQEEPPPDVDLPQVIDDDFFNEKTISFGAKSCPPDHEINLTPFLETTVGVSFQPLCDFASLIYYMVMAASYIIAAYISIGVARNG